MSLEVLEELPHGWGEEPVVQAAFGALDSFTEATQVDVSLQRGRETVHLLGDFMPDVAPAAVAVAALHDLPFRKISRSRAAPAKAALHAFAEHIGPGTPEWMYMSSVLPDMRYVEESSTSQETFNADSDMHLAMVLDARIKNAHMPPKLWSERIGFASPHYMGDIIREVNSEAFPLVALRNAAILRRVDAISPRSLYRTIYGGEALVAPVTELLRLDALASFERSLGRVERLRQMGGSAVACVERAEAIQDMYQTKDAATVKNLMDNVLTSLFGEHVHSRFVVEDRVNHGIRFGEFVAATPGFDFRGLLRTKPVGNIAQKIFEDGYDSIDIYGMTFVAKDVAELAELYGSTIQKLQDAIGVKFVASQSRPGKPFKVQGDEVFIRDIVNHPTLAGALKDDLKTQIDIPPAVENGFRVAKLTFMVRTTILGRTLGVPFEIQMMTEDDRKKSQTGETSHAMREAIKRGIDVAIDPAILEGISLRGNTKTIGTLIWPASIERGAKFRASIARTR